MKISLASILLGAATLIGGTLGTAHTHHGAFATHLHPRQSPLYQGFEELANLSTILFAWQLAGGAPNQTTLQYMCTNFSMISGTWGAVGFKLPLIKQVLDSTDGAAPNPTAAAAKLAFYNTEIFVTQILNVAPGSLTFLRILCRDLNPSLLSSANLNATRVQNAVCGAANITVPAPDPAGGSPETGYQLAQALSNMYAWEAIGISNDTSYLTAYCNNFDQLDNNLAQQGLVTSEIKQVFCQNKNSPPSPARATVEQTYFYTNIFLQTLLHISEVYGYIRFLCANLSPVALYSLGLDGARVSTQVCSVNSTGLTH